jgi:hypothetical protein
MHTDVKNLFSWNTKQLFLWISVDYKDPRNARNDVRPSVSRTSMTQALAAPPHQAAAAWARVCRLPNHAHARSPQPTHTPVRRVLQSCESGVVHRVCTALAEPTSNRQYGQRYAHGQRVLRPQISVWDRIIMANEDTVIDSAYLRCKYKVVDQGHNLRGRAFNLTLHWNLIPYVGKISWNQVTTQVTAFPAKCVAHAPSRRSQTLTSPAGWVLTMRREHKPNATLLLGAAQIG